jgi:hypothetical protein
MPRLDAAPLEEIESPLEAELNSVCDGPDPA